MMDTVTRSWCESCPWEDTSDVVSRADKHSRDQRHVTHTLTVPKPEEKR